MAAATIATVLFVFVAVSVIRITIAVFIFVILHRVYELIDRRKLASQSNGT